MADEMRTCSRTGCRWPAAAALSFRYDARQAWLLDLSAQPDPSLYDLCPHHADTLVVPRGWERVDERTAPPVVAEPAGRDLVGRPIRRPPAPRGVPRPVGASARHNRYAGLLLELPRVAAALSGGRQHPPAGTPSRSGPVPSRELAPLPPAEAPTAPDAPAPRGSTLA